VKQKQDGKQVTNHKNHNKNDLNMPFGVLEIASFGPKLSGRLAVLGEKNPAEEKRREQTQRKMHCPLLLRIPTQ
jgi:hypothetical protein